MILRTIITNYSNSLLTQSQPFYSRLEDPLGGGIRLEKGIRGIKWNLRANARSIETPRRLVGGRSSPSRELHTRAAISSRENGASGLERTRYPRRRFDRDIIAEASSRLSTPLEIVSRIKGLIVVERYDASIRARHSIPLWLSRILSASLPPLSLSLSLCYALSEPSCKRSKLIRRSGETPVRHRDAVALA